MDDKQLELVHQIAATCRDTDSSVILHPSDQEQGNHGRFDGEIEIRNGKRHRVILHPVRGAVGLAAVEHIARVSRDCTATVVVLATRAGRELRTALRELGLGYMDLAGNCHLELDDGNVTVHIEGRRRASQPVGTGALRAAGYRVLFTLLANPRLLKNTVRDISQTANASRHAVQSLMARLRDEGILIRAGRSKHLFAPAGRETCIDRFTVGWADVLRGRLLVGRFRLRERDPDEVAKNIVRTLHDAGVPFGFGGARGSSHWLRYLHSDQTTIHVDAWDSAMQRDLGAAPDRHGPLHVFRTMTPLDLDSGTANTAHPLLIHAELARSGEPRARETAGLLLERIANDPT